MKLFNRLLLLGTLCLVLGSCTDDEVETFHTNTGLVVRLALPVDQTVDINTRSTSADVINDVLVVMLKDGKVKHQSFSNLSGSSFTITQFTPKAGDAVYVFCNTEKTSVDINADTEDKLLKSMTTSNTSADLMYSKSTSIYDGGQNEMKLEHSLAKISLYSYASGLSVANWKICNVPDRGFMSGTNGYPTGTTFANVVEAGKDSCAYVVPRKDNSTVASRTYLLLQVDNKGWYRMDFCDGSQELDFTATPTFMDIKRNYRYRFNILSVKNDGYLTEEEAANNPGSNIVYKMEITDGDTSLSNGQYSLVTSNDKIELPSLNYKGSLQVMNISVKVPDALKGAISGPYSVSLNNTEGLILSAASTSGNTINLLDIVGTSFHREIPLALTVENGANAKLQSTSNIEIRIGNLVKQFPITLQTANCYMHNFQERDTLLIPIAHANKVKMRINLEDEVNEPKAEILWSDQPMNFDDITVNYESDIESIRVKKNSPGSFIGNFVVAIIVDSKIKWSWHVWCMDDTSIEYDEQLARYELKNIQQHGNTEWMDRYLGATSVAENDIANEGLLYQWGRKDPFPGASVSGQSAESTLYHKSGSYLFTAPHPTYGANIVVKNEPDNIEYAIENPTKFIKANDYSWHIEGVDFSKTINGDWATNAYNKENSYLWTTEEGNKSNYDPCPIGWRVAYGGKTGPWISFRVNQVTDVAGGYKWKDIYYPWTPYRNTAGLLVITQSVLLWWGNIPTLGENVNSSIIGGDKGIDYSFVLPTAYGASVRCVRE